MFLHFNVTVSGFEITSSYNPVPLAFLFLFTPGISEKHLCTDLRGLKFSAQCWSLTVVLQSDILLHHCMVVVSKELLSS